MKNNIRIALIFIAIILALILAALVFDKAVSVQPNDESVTGNTASNLYNGGLFCEVNGKVYFSNAYDNGSLYVMNPDETDIKKLNSVSVNSINSDGKRIYYSQTGKTSGSGLGYMRKNTGLFSCTTKGGSSINYSLSPVQKVVLSGNNLIYQNYSVEENATIYGIGIDKSNDHMITDEFIDPSSIYFDTIYYSGVGLDHYLYNMDINTGKSSCLWEHNVYNPIYSNDGWVYFIDLETNYELHRYNPSTGIEMTLADERVDFFNMIGNVIYYQVSTGKNPGIRRVLIDGSAGDTLVSGVFTNLQTTSEYLYFTEFGKDVPVYHINHNNPYIVSTFME